MKLPVIKKATWEKLYYPEAKWVVVEMELIPILHTALSSKQSSNGSVIFGMSYE